MPNEVAVSLVRYRSRMPESRTVGILDRATVSALTPVLPTPIVRATAPGGVHKTMLRRWAGVGVLAALAVSGVACGSAPTPTLSPGPVVDPEEAQVLRELAFGYWEAFNAYEPDRVLAYLEDEYRQQREEQIRTDIGRIDLFNVQLGVSEEAPPWIIDHNHREMYLTMKEPLGTRRIRMEFRDVAGEWKITSAEEVK